MARGSGAGPAGAGQGQAGQGRWGGQEDVGWSLECPSAKDCKKGRPLQALDLLKEVQVHFEPTPLPNENEKLISDRKCCQLPSLKSLTGHQVTLFPKPKGGNVY